MTPRPKKVRGRVSPDDLRRGLFVIVEEWLDEEFKTPEEDAYLPYWARAPKPARKPVGDPMEVLAVELPFITVQLCAPPRPRGVLNTKTVRLQAVGLDYVRSLIPQFGQKREAPAKSQAAPADIFGRQIWKDGRWVVDPRPRED